MSLVFRAYHAMQRSGLKNTKGEPTFALFAFVNIITNLLEKENPEKIAVVFDRPEPTFRHELYSKYKANRDAFPDDLVPQLPKIKEFLDLIGIPRFETPGFEADDIIGTMTTIASAANLDVACLTNDKDYYQLVNNHVKLYKPNPKGDDDFFIVDTNEVYRKFGVTPDKVIDVLALIGDSSDNIPGVKGIGEKTAIPLIQKYGSIENLYEHIEEIDKKSVKEKLIAGKENSILAKKLVTIKTDVPLEIPPQDIKPGTTNFTELDKFFADAGFHTQRKKWAEKALGYASIQTNEHFNEPIELTDQSGNLSSTKHNYIHVFNNDLLNDLLNDLTGINLLSVDLETSSLDRNTCEIVGIALSAEENKAYYISVFTDDVRKTNKEPVAYSADSLFANLKPVQELDKENEYRAKLLPLNLVLNKLKPILESKHIGKIGQNIKFDAYIFHRFGINLHPIVFDTMIASYLLNSGERHNLDALSKKWLNYTPIPISSLIGEKKSEQKSMKDIDPAIIAEYAGEDADLALKLHNILKPKLKEENLTKLADEIEFPLIDVLVKMESNGVAIDAKMLSEMSLSLDSKAKELAVAIYNEAGVEFNIDSPKQLGEILFDKMGIPAISKTRTGPSTNVNVLSELAPIYPIAAYMLEYRQLQKLRSTYVDALPRLINPATGRIHTTYNQTVASTGRLSSTDPNLQNIPIRTDLGKEIRKAFVSGRKDALILSADYSQIELRIMAYISGDKQLIESFRNGLDIHSATASVLFEKPLIEIDSDMRRIAKTVNFGIMYGLGAFGLAQRLGISRTEGKKIIDNYFEKYPGIRKYIDITIKNAEQQGFAETLCGRKRYFPNINSKNRNLKTIDERAAINFPIQGTASDMMKLAMIKVDRAMTQRNFKSLMMLQVHDELVFEALTEEIDDLRQLVKREMESALGIGDVPVVVDTGVGKNWLEAH